MPEPAVRRKFFFCLLLSLSFAAGSFAQMPRWVKHVPDTSGRAITVEQKALEADVAYLSSELCAGRATGSRGGAEAAFFLLRRFRALGLKAGVLAFSVPESGALETRVGHNVWCALPPSEPSARSRWIVVLASYDGLGTLEGRMYPGADANASGVAALLSLAARLSSLPQRRDGVLFVALDAHNAGRAGAEALCGALSAAQAPFAELPLRLVRLVLNLDTVGSALAPVDKAWKAYLMALGGASYLPALEKCNSGLELRLYDSYYRSRDFTDLFYRRLGDHRPFLEKGLRCVMMTSGITDHTNKVSDTAETLHYPMFEKRVTLIERWLKTLL